MYECGVKGKKADTAFEYNYIIKKPLFTFVIITEHIYRYIDIDNLPKFAVIPSRSLGFLFLGLPFWRGVGAAPLKNGGFPGGGGSTGGPTGGICGAWWWNSGLGKGET